MTEVVRKGIQEAQVQLQKANEERLLEEVRLTPDSQQASGREGPPHRVQGAGPAQQSRAGLVFCRACCGRSLSWGPY